MNRKNIYVALLVGFGLTGMSVFANSANTDSEDQRESESVYKSEDRYKANATKKVKGKHKAKGRYKQKAKHLSHVDQNMGKAKRRKVEKVYDEVMNDPGNFFKSPTYIVNKNGKSISLSGEGNSVDDIYNQ